MAPTPIYEVDKILKEELGWLFNLGLLTDDCYGTVHITYRSGDLTEIPLIAIYPEWAGGFGAFCQDPSGWVQRYSRSNPYSTAGIYYVSIDTGGYHGSPWPFLPPIRVKLSLGKDSTQATASVTASAGVIAITDTQLFIQSLRRVLDPNASLHIDPALLDLTKKMFEDVKGARK